MLWLESNGNRRLLGGIYFMVNELTTERKRTCPIAHEPSTI